MAQGKETEIATPSLAAVILFAVQQGANRLFMHVDSAGFVVIAHRFGVATTTEAFRLQNDQPTCQQCFIEQMAVAIVSDGDVARKFMARFRRSFRACQAVEVCLARNNIAWGVGLTMLGTEPYRVGFCSYHN